MKSKATALVLATISGLMLFLVGLGHQLLVTEDGHEYIKYAERLLDGSLQDMSSHDRESVRTVGYPALLAASLYFFSPDIAVRVLHATLLGSAIFIILWLANRENSTMQVLVALGCFLLNTFQFSLAVLTEWTVMCSLLVWSVAHWTGVSGNKKALVVFSSIGGLIPIIRPAAIMTVPLGLLSVVRHKGVGKGLKCLLAMLHVTPLIMLLLWHRAELGYFGISPIGKLNLFGLASTLTSAPSDAFHEERLKQFATEFNSIKYTWVRGGGKNNTLSKEATINRNLSLVAESMRKKDQLSYDQLAQLGFAYAIATIKHAWPDYITHLGDEILHSFVVMPTIEFTLLGVCLLICAVYYQFLSQANRSAIYMMLYLHLASQAIAISLDPAMYRQYALTFEPLLFIALVNAADLLKARIKTG